MSALRRGGVDVVVLVYVSVPVVDRGVPERAVVFGDAVAAVVARLQNGQRAIAHCRMGVGRSSLFVAAALFASGVDLDVAWDAIAAARGRPVPDVPEQRAWLARTAPLLR